MRVRHKIINNLLIGFLFVSPALGMEGNMDQDAEEQRVLVAQRFGIEEIRNMSIDQFLIKKREINPQDRGEFFSQEEFEYLILKEKASAFDQMQELFQDGVLDGELPSNPKEAIGLLSRLGVIFSKSEGLIVQKNMEIEKLKKALTSKDAMIDSIESNISPIYKALSEQKKQKLQPPQKQNIRTLTVAFQNHGNQKAFSIQKNQRLSDFKD